LLHIIVTLELNSTQHLADKCHHSNDWHDFYFADIDF
jgi:hypothetical protein